MLSCGSFWKPTKINRVIEQLDSSTQPVIVETDAGIGYLKGMGNPQGDGCLCTELVAAELASWLGLEVPSFAVIALNFEVEMKRAGSLQLGPAFISRQIENPIIGPTDAVLKRLMNRQDLGKIIIFDTWIRNFDRWFNEVENPDNVMFRPVSRNRYVLMPFDHSDCFSEMALDGSIDSELVIRDQRIYGFFPAFRPYVTQESVGSGLERLRTFNQVTAKLIVDSVPQAWGLTTSERKAWVNMIYKRAKYVAEHSGRTILEQGDLFEGPH